MRKSIIRDINMAESGCRKIEWAKGYMPVLSAIEEFIEEQPFAGKKMSCQYTLRQRRHIFPRY